MQWGCNCRLQEQVSPAPLQLLCAANSCCVAPGHFAVWPCSFHVKPMDPGCQQEGLNLQSQELEPCASTAYGLGARSGP